MSGVLVAGRYGSLFTQLGWEQDLPAGADALPGYSASVHVPSLPGGLRSQVKQVMEYSGGAGGARDPPFAAWDMVQLLL